MTNIITAVVILLILVFAILFLTGCTTKVSYDHSFMDEQNIKHNIHSVYTAGVGNSKKADIIVMYPDGAMWLVGSSTMDQDEYMKVLSKYGELIKELAEDFNKLYLVGERNGRTTK